MKKINANLYITAFAAWITTGNLYAINEETKIRIDSLQKCIFYVETPEKDLEGTSAGLYTIGSFSLFH